MSTLAIATAILMSTTTAEARKPRAPAPPAAPPAPAEAPQPPPPPAFAPDAPPPAGTHRFSFAFGRGRLGVGASSMTAELRRFFGAPADAGILVQSVDTGTPASKAGVRVGDVIVAVDGDRIDDVGDVAQALGDREAGEAVDLEIFRDKKSRRLRAELHDDATAPGFAWHGELPGLPGGVHVFGGDDELRGHVEALERRLEQLERRLERRGGERPPAAPSAPRRAPRRAPRANHT